MKPHLWLRGFITGLMLLPAAGQGCDGISPPQCFRRDNTKSVYICEWNSSYKDRDHYIHIGLEKSFLAERPLNRKEIRREQLFQENPVDIWLEPVGLSNCSSKNVTVTLKDIIKYDQPQNVTVKWSRDNLTLRWRAPERHPAAVEIWHRSDSAQQWSKILRNTTGAKDNRYGLTVVNLTKASVRQFQMRQRSMAAKNPLWSDWSNILTLPIEFVKISKKVMNGTRRLTLKWKPVPSYDGEAVSYRVETGSFTHCNKHQKTPKTLHFTNVSFSAVNISVTASNGAGFSPPANFSVRPETPPDLKVCNGTALDEKRKRNVYSEWYKLEDGRAREDTVVILPSTKKSDDVKQRKAAKLEDFLPYVYFEHRCVSNPQTLRMCLYYKKQDKPESPPPDFITSAENQTSATLSWAPIPTVKQRGFVTHYSLCIADVSAQGKPDCRNISASLTSYVVQKLTPGTKYNISLKGVTSVGDGPAARITINTQYDNRNNVWVSFGLLFGFFFLSIMCTFVFTRIKNKIFPPVPIPVIAEFPAYQVEVQDLLERKEEVDEVTLVQLHPECCPVDGSSDLEKEENDQISSTKSEESEHTPKESTEEPTDTVQNEIALLIYRNGLVFDVNLDSC